jgi:AraC-like DNA-binding protein
MTFREKIVSFCANLSYDYNMNATSEPIIVSVTVLSQMFLYLASLKVDTDAFLHSLGIDPQTVKSPDAYIPIETYLLIQDEAAHYVNDPYFGLHMGEFAEAGSWSILGYMMMNCKTLGEAFEKSTRYSRIIGNLIEGDVHLKFNKIKVTLFTPPHAPKMSRHCFEATISSSVRLMRTLTGVKLSPLEVTFIYPEPESAAEYERIFCCPVSFGHKENSFTIDMGIIHTPILLPNPGLLQYFENYAQDFLAGLDRNKEHTRAVTKIILSRMDDEALSIEKVAREMAVSVRTLQNRLKEEGVVFSDLLMDTRKKLANKYLQENYTVEQITYLLGFSEPSVFRKAFKKWAGVTPREFREGSYSGASRVAL